MPASKPALLALGIWLLLSGCASPRQGLNPVASETPVSVTKTTPTSTPTQTPAPFRVIGYATDALVVERIPFSKLTHINYAFLIPNADGTFEPLFNAWKINSLLQDSHQNKVKVLLSIGGWGQDAKFEELAADPQKRAVFIRGAISIMDQYGFDGLDIDWEYPDPGQSAKNFTALIQELRTALVDKLLTAAVVSSGDEVGLGIPSETFGLLSFVNVMTYDEPNHATMAQFESGLNYWLRRGIPPEKLVMGIPFYSRPSEIPFRELVQGNPAAARLDTFNYNGSQERYNGLDTVQKKTRLALKKASGIMFWALDHDADGEASLLNMIFQTVIKNRH